MSYSSSISSLPYQLSSTPSSTSGAKRFAAGALNGAFGALAGASGLGSGLDLTDGIDGDLGNLDDRGLFELQLKAQRELQKFTMISNLSKTEHDTRMAAVRNMRP